MTKLSDEEIVEFLRRLQYTEGNINLFTEAKERSGLDWATLLWDAIQDWRRIDREINPSSWKESNKIHNK